jgi:hypothetical protein
MEQLNVGKSLTFVPGSPLPNIEGNWSTKKMVMYDDFTGLALDTGKWVYAGDNGGTEAITEAQGGTVTLTTGATDDDRSLFATPLIFLAAQKPIIEARFKVSASTTVGLNFGFFNETTVGDNELWMEINAGAATLANAKSDDCVGFVYDTDGTPDVWRYAANKAGTEGTPVNVPCYGVVTSGTAQLANSPLKVVSGVTTLTIQKTGTFYVTLPDGCTGTLANATGTFTGSTITFATGTTAVVCTVVGTATLTVGAIPTTSWETLRIALDASANAAFWRNGVYLGGLRACTTAATPLCAGFGIIARTTSARVLTVDYFKAWQDRA